MIVLCAGPCSNNPGAPAAEGEGSLVPLDCNPAAPAAEGEVVMSVHLLKSEAVMSPRCRDCRRPGPGGGGERKYCCCWSSSPPSRFMTAAVVRVACCVNIDDVAAYMNDACKRQRERAGGALRWSSLREKEGLVRPACKHANATPLPYLLRMVFVTACI